MPKTPKAAALGGALRQAREQKGLGLREFAAQLGRDPGILSRWESGERTPRPEDVARLLSVLGVDSARYEDLMTLVQGSKEPQWVATTLPEQRQQMAAFIEHEQKAALITQVSPLLLPGLVQIPEYTRAIMARGGIPAAEISERVAARLARKEVITGPRSAQLLALIGEAALYQQVCARPAMIAQLRHLLEIAHLRNAEVRVAPFGGGWHPGLEGAFTLMRSESGRVVFIETRRSSLLLHQEEDIRAYEQAADNMEQVTMSRDRSARFISDLILRMESSDDPARVAQVEP